MENGVIVKTMEAPRDMQVPDLISQYTALDGRMEATAEMVMLLRPDYVVYDELRRTEDFRVFADMRLAGVGMIGVLHAENVHAALLRFLSRVDFGTLSRVVDTIVIVEEGEIAHIYDLEFGLRVPDSMPGDGAVTPVVTVVDAATGLTALEVFRYDGEIVIMPLALPVPIPERGGRPRLEESAPERAPAAPPTSGAAGARSNGSSSARSAGSPMARSRSGCSPTPRPWSTSMTKMSRQRSARVERTSPRS
jgi:ATPase